MNICYLYLFNNINKVYEINEIDNKSGVVAKHVLFQVLLPTVV